MNAIFVNFPGGAGGMFITRICSILKNNFKPSLDIERETYYHMHPTDKSIELGDLIFSGAIPNYSDACINNYPTEWFRQQLSDYLPNPDKKLTYIIANHMINIENFLRVFPTVPIVRVVPSSEDYQQIAYNLIKKLFDNNLKKQFIQGCIDFLIHSMQIDLLESVKNNIDVDNDRLNTWLYWMSNKSMFDHSNYHYGNEYPIFDIKFEDIKNKNINIDKLAGYLNVVLTPEMRYEVDLLHTQYAAAQIKIPWTLDTNEYTVR